MAEEPENNVEEPQAAEDAPASEAPSASEAESQAADSGASASDADAPSAESSPAAPAEPAAPVTPKERRQRARAAKAPPTRAQTSPEERQAERDAERQRKAQVRSSRRKREREKARGKRTPAEPLPPRREQHPGRQKTRQGIVVSDRASKTIVVRIDVSRRHRSYEKVVRTSTTLHAHDEREDAHIGDTVVVRESRPLSKTKRWRLVEVLERAK